MNSSRRRSAARQWRTRTRWRPISWAPQVSSRTSASRVSIKRQRFSPCSSERHNSPRGCSGHKLVKVTGVKNLGRTVTVLCRASNELVGRIATLDSCAWLLTMRVLPDAGRSRSVAARRALCDSFAREKTVSCMTPETEAEPLIVSCVQAYDRWRRCAGGRGVAEAGAIREDHLRHRERVHQRVRRGMDLSQECSAVSKCLTVSDAAGVGGCAVHLGTERRLERTPDSDRIAKPPRERGPLRWDQRSPGTFRLSLTESLV